MMNNLIELSGAVPRQNLGKLIHTARIGGKILRVYANRGGALAATLDGCPVVLNGPLINLIRRGVSAVRARRAERVAAGKPASAVQNIVQSVGQRLFGQGTQVQFNDGKFSVVGGEVAPADVYSTGYGPQRVASTPEWFLPVMMGAVALMILKK